MSRPLLPEKKTPGVALVQVKKEAIICSRDPRPPPDPTPFSRELGLSPAW